MAASVLCIESDPVLCQLLTRALREQGHRVVEASEAVRALALAAEEPPDLVLLSVDLSQGAGLAPLEAIRELPTAGRGIPVVLLCDRPPLADETLRAGELEAACVLTKPVALRRLIAVVNDVLAKSGQALARAEGAGEGVSGRLDRMPFPFLLHHLHGLRADGILHLTRDRTRKWVQLRNGQATGVRSNLVSECLGSLLVRTGRISREVFEESRHRMGGGRLQGEVLVAMSALSEPEVSEALRQQAEDKFFEIFAWEEGEFRFERGGRLQKSNGLASANGTANLILRGVRGCTPLAHIDAALGRRADRALARAESAFYRFQEMDLEPELRAWVEEIDGLFVQQALGQNEDRRRCLYALLATGLLTMRAPGVAASARPIAARREVIRTAPRRDPDEERMGVELAELAQRSEGQDPFELLGVAENATEDEVRVAYERLCKLTHPDRVGASNSAVLELAEQVFQRVEAAFQVLADPRRRQEQVLARRRAGREAAQRDEGRRAVEAELRFQKGKAALRQSDYEAALAHFREAIELFPEEGEYHAHLGWTLHCSRPDDLKRAEEAITHVKRGIKLASDREKPYLFMGRICNAIGRPEAAMKMFARALHIQPDCVEALRELRLLNMRREKERGFIARMLRR